MGRRERVNTVVVPTAQLTYVATYTRRTGGSTTNTRRTGCVVRPNTTQRNTFGCNNESLCPVLVSRFSKPFQPFRQPPTKLIDYREATSPPAAHLSVVTVRSHVAPVTDTTQLRSSHAQHDEPEPDEEDDELYRLYYTVALCTTTARNTCTHSLGASPPSATTG